MKTIKIGIDFGTSYSFCGFLRGDSVMPLIASYETYGVPSIFYYDRGQKLTGRSAERSAARRPEYAVRSVKRKLHEKEFILGEGKKFTPAEVVEEIIGGIVRSAEEQLEQNYPEEYTGAELEAVITVPIDFSEPMKQLIREAAGRVVTKNGKKLRVLRLIPEPIAAAIEYFGVKKEKNSNIVVFDLGGGTLDVALVRANASYAGIPYEVIDQQGNRSLGGDDWDAKFAERLKTLYVKETGNTVTKRIEEALTLEARIIKEELTKNDKYINDMEIKGEYIPVEVTRAEFEKDTRPLLLKARETVLQLMNRVKNEKIDHVILTGGSCYMPQIKAELENLCKTGTFPGNPDVLMVEPEHAIAYGAARYAATLNFPKPVPKPGPDPEPDPYRIITMRATHSYGIRYTNSEGSYVDFLIKKGQKLPVVAKTKSYTRFENQKESVFAVYESDYMGTEPVYDKSIWGENVMTITLKRTETRIPKGRESEQTLTLTEDGIITCRCVDQVSGKSVENKVVLKRQI